MGASWNDIEALNDNNPNKKLLGGNVILSDQNKKLQNAIAVGYEAENVAKDTKLNLQGDTEKMNKMRDNLGRIQNDMSLSDKLLDVIKWNEQKNSIILYGVVWILVTAIIAVFVYKFAR